MNVGDYVRLNNSVYDIVVINRIAEIYEDTILTENDGSMYQGEYAKEEIIKSSPNIIDLIEVGDYVNGERVFGFGKFIYDDDTEEICSLTLETTISCLPEDIKSIVTKEMFANAEYRVESN